MFKLIKFIISLIGVIFLFSSFIVPFFVWWYFNIWLALLSFLICAGIFFFIYNQVEPKKEWTFDDELNFTESIRSELADREEHKRNEW